jgi:hypothetical protein
MNTNHIESHKKGFLTAIGLVFLESERTDIEPHVIGALIRSLEAFGFYELSDCRFLGLTAGTMQSLESIFSQRNK